MPDLQARVLEMIKNLSPQKKRPGGISTLTQILKKVDRTTEKQILHSFNRDYPELADELQKKYFTFEDLVFMEDIVLQKVFREIKTSTWAMALKGTSDALKDKVFQNLSKHAGDMIREEMEAIGPKPKSKVEAAQREIATLLLRWKDVIP